MTIDITDLKFYYSGGATKSTADGDQGGTISSVQIPEQILSTTPFVKNTMWNDVTSTNRVAGVTQYRCYYLKNTHATQTASNVKCYRDAVTSQPDTISLGYSGNAASVPEQLLSTTTANVYNVAITAADEKLDNTRVVRAETCQATTATIYGVPISQVSFYLLRFGNPTGTLYVRQRNTTTGSITGAALAEIGSMDVATINASTPTLYTFTASSPRALAVNEGITIEYGGGSSSNYITVSRDIADPYVGGGERYHDGTSWHGNSAVDLCGTMLKAGLIGDRTAPTGVTFSNPIDLASAISLPNLAPGAYTGIWIKRVVPVNCSAKVGDNFQLAVQFDSPTP